jgi:hypothetical protein
MKLIIFLFVIILSTSCGVERASDSTSSSKIGGTCNLNGQSVPCANLKGSDGEGIDLLESLIDVPVKVQNSEITFLIDKSSFSTGRRISCETKVRKGEVYRYSLRGDRLLLETSEGSYEMVRLSDGDGLNSSWMWKGYVDEGTHLLRKLTIINNERALLRTYCEL